MNAYIPQAKQLASDGLELANDIIDDVAASLDAPGAFDNVKVAVKDFFADVQSRYYKDGDFILPADSFESMTQGWTKDFEKRRRFLIKSFWLARSMLYRKNERRGWFKPDSTL